MTWLGRALLAAALSAPQGGGKPDWVQVLIPVGLLIAVVTIAGACIMLYRARVLGRDRSEDTATSLFETLRAMRDRGEISPEEFEKARSATRARMRAGDAPHKGR